MAAPTRPTFYEPLGAAPDGAVRYRPTIHTEGAWQPGEQHMAPVTGIIVHAVDRYVAERFADDGLQVARLSFEILGMIAAEDFEIAVDVVRPGRTIQLLEATLTIGGRPIIRARIWRLSAQDTSAVAGGAPDALPDPEGLAPWSNDTGWPGAYIRSLDLRAVGEIQPGRGRAWIRSAADLVSGEPASELAEFMRLVDTANGIAVRVPPGSWAFPNVELSIHLYRQPRGPWVGLDTTVVFGEHGLGLTNSTVHDLDGAVGVVQQTLTVRPLG